MLRGLTRAIWPGSVAVLIVLVVARAALADWTQHQGDAAHSGYVPASLQPADFHEIWSKVAPPYSAGPGDRSVAIDGQRVYATMLEGYGASGPYHVLGFDLQTGQEQWRHSILVNSHAGVSAPSVQDGMVYVHAYGHSATSQYPALIGLDANTGTRLFRTTHDGQWTSGSRPTPIGSQVFAGGGYYGGVDAYTAQGVKTWFHPLGSANYHPLPAADAQRIYAYYGRLYAINRQTGRSDFEIPGPGGLLTVTLGTQNNALSRDVNYGLICFDLTSRTLRWQQPGFFTGAMALGNGVIVMPESSTLAFLDEATGNRLGSWDAGSSLIDRNVILTNTHAFVASQTHVYAIDLATRQTAWSAPVGGSIALANGVLVVANPQGITAFAVPEPTGILALSASGLFMCGQRPRRPINQRV